MWDKQDFITKMRTCFLNCKCVGSWQHGQDVFKGWEKALKRLHVQATRETQSVFVYLSSELHSPLAPCSSQETSTHTAFSLASPSVQLLPVGGRLPVPPLLCHQLLPHPTIYHPAKEMLAFLKLFFFSPNQHPMIDYSLPIPLLGIYPEGQGGI